MKEKIKAILRWILVSSENPEKTSLMIRGILVALIPKIVVVAGLLNLGVTDTQVQYWINIVAVGSTATLTLVGIGWTIYGGVRKIKNSLIPKLPTIAPHDERGDL